DRRLAASPFADQPQGLPLVHIEGDDIYRHGHLIPADMKILLQIFHLQNFFRNFRHLAMPPPTASFTGGAIGCSSQQVSWCVSDRTVTSGIHSLQIFIAYWQRSTKGHPLGGESRSGGFPGMDTSFFSSDDPAAASRTTAPGYTDGGSA